MGEIKGGRAPTEGPRDIDLSPRQAQVVRRIADGSTQKEIAQELGISRSTVDTHIQAVAAKLPGDGSPVHRIVTWWGQRARRNQASDPTEKTAFSDLLDRPPIGSRGGSGKLPKILRTGPEIPPGVCESWVPQPRKPSTEEQESDHTGGGEPT